MTDNPTQRLDDLQIRFDVRELSRTVERQAKEIAELETAIKAVNDRLALREAERSAAERRNLLWGLALLGSIVTTLGGIIWSNLSTILKGAP